MAVEALVPERYAASDVDGEVALTLPPQRLMIFQDCEVEMLDRVGVLVTAVDTPLLTMPPRRKVLRCCVITLFARTWTCYVGRCRVTHLHARSLWCSGFV